MHQQLAFLGNDKSQKQMILNIDFQAVLQINFPQYMVYMLKFDIAHSHAIYHKKEMNVRESPTGQVRYNFV